MDIVSHLILLQYPGITFGLIGAVFVSLSQARYRRWGFLLWICSNVCLITWAICSIIINQQEPHHDSKNDPWGILAMYIVYSITSILGWWNNREAHR